MSCKVMTSGKTVTEFRKSRVNASDEGGRTSSARKAVSAQFCSWKSQLNQELSICPHSDFQAQFLLDHDITFTNVWIEFKLYCDSAT